jgi:hypothetical protein
MLPTMKEAIKASINAGVDMSMIPYEYNEFCTLLVELVNEGEVPLARINDAVTRIVALKLQLNLFDTPNTSANDYPEFHSAAFRQASYDAAADGITLLKNDRNILPLKKGKEVILALSEGRPRAISKVSSQVAAIVHTYLPGMYGADALADILIGKVNPSGKLPYTYPAFPNSLVPYYHKHSEEQILSPGAYNYEGDYNPEYPFGFGLSYTTFEYANVRINKTQLPLDSQEEIEISVDVKNTGAREGKEVVQLYSSDLYASLIPDVKRLRRFEKIALQAGEIRTVTFTFTLADLSFVNLENKRVVESGDFELQIGASSADIKEKVKFTVLH